MNRSKDDSTAHKVYRRIQNKGADTLWTFADFADLPTMSVAATLSRLSKQGTLERVRRGVYYFPKTSTFGKSRPDPEKVTEAILRINGTRTVKSGSSQFSRLGLTTQVSGALTLSADRRVDQKNVMGIPVRVRHRRLAEQKEITPDERTVLDALRDIHRIPDTTPDQVLDRLGTLLEQKKIDFSRLARFALAEPPRVRALLGALGDGLSHRKPATEKTLMSLRKTLNGLSKYRIPGLATALPTAKSWGIE